MGKLYWTSVVLVIVIGVAVVLTFGLKGKTVPKIKWSHFVDASDVSLALQERLSRELTAFDIIFIGPHPENDLHIEASFKLISWLRSLKNHVFIADPRLLEKMKTSADISLNLMTERDRFLEGLSKIPQGYRVIVWAPNLYVTHIIRESPINLMAADLKDQNYGVLTFTTFPGDRQEERDFEIPCRTGDGDPSGLSQLGCFVRGQSRSQYRKEKIKGNIYGFLNHVRSREYMFFLKN